MKKNKMKVLLKGNDLFFSKYLLVGILLLFQLSAFAQVRTISGTVTGIDNQPLIGVTVIAQGTAVGALTDIDGKFKLSIPATAKVLQFSFIGMDSKVVPVGISDVYNVILTESVVGLEEVVVVGYGTQKKISVTGAIVSVGSEFLVKSPNATISNTLAGRVTGLTTVQYTGRPGDDEPQIYIRGIGSLTESASTPLMLVDGVERPFTQLDPNEIESVSILKDASATAVYGIRGANGVIIVSTKRGVEGAPKISFTSSAGLSLPTRLAQMCNSYQYATKYNEALLSDNPNAPLEFSSEAVEAFRTGSNPLIYPSIDWPNMIIKPYALQNQQNINMTGGSKVVKYFISLGSLNQDGLFNTFSSASDTYNYEYKRYNYRANIDIDMTESTKFSLSIGGRSELRQEPNTGFETDLVFFNIYRSVPFSGQVYEGKQILNGGRYIAMEKRDGLSTMGYGKGVRRELSSIMNLDIGVTQKMDFITKGLSWRFKVSNDNTSVHSKTRSTSNATYDPYYKCDVDLTAIGDSTIVFRKSGSDGLLGYDESSAKARSWYMETAISYARDFGSHHLTGLLLYNESKRYYPGTYPDIPTGYVGLAARGTYNYKLKYMVDFNIGYNGSENFAPGKRFGLFPAIAAGWVVTEESFLKDKISFLDYMKLRFSYGVVGNDKQGSNRFLYMADSYSANSGGYSFGTTTTSLQILASESRLGNPDVTWEKARKQNYGVDLKIFKGKLGVTADYFFEFRNNILTTRNTVPSILSITLPVSNIGEVQNKGFEVELKWRDKIGQVNYYLSTNLSFARNKILFMDEIPKNEEYLVQTGRRVNELFGYVFDGFFSVEDTAHLEDFADQMYTPKPGDVRYKDLNDDGVINTDDRKVIGFPDYPEYNFSLSGGFDFKGFDFSMMWNGVTNVSRMVNDTWQTAFGETADRGLLLWLYENSWTPETAETAKAPRISFSGRINNTMSSSLWLRDASYIRLKNLEIGYSFSAAALKRIGISRMRVSASGYDLMTFDKIKYFDPEGRTSRPDYPLVKIFNLGLNVNF